ncbi:hypothetical protein TKK_0010408 [Trichogramma kaykai]
MLKCWMRVRGTDTEHIIPLDSSTDFEKYSIILDHIYKNERFGFFFNQEEEYTSYEDLYRLCEPTDEKNL